MKWVKLCALLLLTLGAMRAGSWTVGWILSKLVHTGARSIAIASNAIAFGVFVGFLLWNLYPGEPLDVAAIVFGLVVYAIYCLTDRYWTPWKITARTQPDGRVR